MFDLPNAKRVRRSELYARSGSASRSPSPVDPELEASYRARLASVYGAGSFPLSVVAPAGRQDESARGDVREEDEEREKEFEFRLFATNGDNDAGGAQKIVLEEEGKGDGGLVKMKDPRVFVVGRAEGERKWGFERMAVGGEEVRKWAGMRAWGLEVPWRVRVVRVSGKGNGGGDGDGDGDGVGEKVIEGGDGMGEGKRKKPGKKRRLILRERKRKREEEAERRRKEKESREEAEREKRTRRNREKKVKRKLKEKAKKAAGQPEGADAEMKDPDPVGGDSDQGSSQ